MATNNRAPYGQGGPVPRNEPEPVPEPEPKSCSRCSCGKGAILPTIFAFACVAVILGAVYLVNRPPEESDLSKRKHDVLKGGDLYSGLIEAVKQEKFDFVASHDEEASGTRFWTVCFRESLLEDVLAGRLCSKASVEDSPATASEIASGDAEDWCSFTAPRLGELKELLSRKGSDRVVLITFNSRNWRNYPAHGVLVMWSDSECPCYMTSEEANQGFGITPEEWADPAGKLFGKKAPFQHTYE
jgi:hypothetical protein